MQSVEPNANALGKSRLSIVVTDAGTVAQSEQQQFRTGARLGADQQGWSGMARRACVLGGNAAMLRA